jgi:hypothetical protein
MKFIVQEEYSLAIWKEIKLGTQIGKELILKIKTMGNKGHREIWTYSKNLGIIFITGFGTVIRLRKRRQRRVSK